MSPSTRPLAFMSLQRLSEVVGAAQFHTYLDRIHIEQRRIYEELLINSGQDIASMGNGVSTVPHQYNGGIVGRGVSGKGWVEYGAIDDAIIEKMKDDEDARVRLQGAEELNKVIKDMPDLSPLLPQMRLFLNFLDSALDEPHNPAAVILILEIYGCLVAKLGPRLKPHLRTLTASLLRHCTREDVPAVRAENLRVIKALLAACGPNQGLNQAFDHLGDKRSAVRESILNVVILALLTFPSYEFDLKVSF